MRSGGLSSAVAGGDFISGVRQGLITSGLNHLASYVANTFKDLTKEFDKQLDVTKKAFEARKNFFDKIMDDLVQHGSSPSSISLAYEMYIEDFVKNVKSGSPYDLKLRKDSEFSNFALKKSNGSAIYKGRLFDGQDFGNYNYGVAAKAFGLSLTFSQLGAGAYQVYEGHSNANWYGTYFDEPKDFFKIKDGYNHFK